MFELASSAPDPALRPYVRGYHAYSERTARPMRRRELPSSDVILVLSLGGDLRLLEAQRGLHTSFVVAGDRAPGEGARADPEVRRALRLLERDDGTPLAEIAVACGYFAGWPGARRASSSRAGSGTAWECVPSNLSKTEAARP